MIIFYAYRVSEDMAYLDQEESRHCMKVLRKRRGGKVSFTDGKGKLYDGEILNVDKEVVLNNITIVKEQVLKSRVIVAVSPTKNLNRFEWFVEKAVEIGITDIIPLNCSRTEKINIKSERTEKIIRSAAKQSLNLNHTILHPLMTIAEIVELYNEEELVKLIASYHPNNTHLFNVTINKDSLILIGPEGDFTEQELILCMNNSFEKVNISNARLRTETAGIVVSEILVLKNELKEQ